MNPVGVDRECDVDTLVNDEPATAHARESTESRRAREQLATAPRACAELHDDPARAARGGDDGLDTRRWELLVRDDGEARAEVSRRRQCPATQSMRSPSGDDAVA
jgi:hypothetical protein